MEIAEPTRVLWIAAEDSRLTVPSPGTAGFVPEIAHGIPEALEYLKRSRMDAAVACLPLPEWSPAEALEELRCADDSVPLIFWDPQTCVADAVRLVKLGAFDVLGGEAGPEQLGTVIQDAIDDRHSRASRCQDVEEPWRRTLIGSSQPFQDVVQLVRLVGKRRSTVLITGETGTGKEMAARAIHMAGPRGRLPMVSVCCSALPEHLLEAELFGHVRGAFTGAINQRVGRFEQAHGSTLFLDEIGEMPLELQAKLLRVLQEREFQRLGSSETVHVDVRVVAATHADLLERRVGPLSRGPVLPSQCGPHAPASPADAHRRHRRAHPSLPLENLPPGGLAAKADLARGAGPLDGVLMAWQRTPVGECHRARRGPQR
jgi:DNA-binding NtrC family response regulator